MRRRIDEILALIDQAAPHWPIFEFPEENAFDHKVIDYENISAETRADKGWAIEMAKSRLVLTTGVLASEFTGFRELVADDMQRNQARTLIQRLNVNRHIKIIYGLDYALELRRVESLAQTDHNSAVYYALISIAGDNAGLARENHGFGYHFHYVHMKPRQNVRTNVLLTFDLSEPVGSADTLYWERHGNYLSVSPERWSVRRCRAIHSAAQPSIHNPGKATFRMPSNQATVLWPL